MRGDVTYFLWHGIRPSYKNIKIWGVRVYIINGRATRKKLDDRSHRGYFMGYADTTGIMLYWKTDQPFVINRDHNVWFDEYNYHLSIEYTQTPGSLLLWQDPEGHIHNSDPLNLIPYELDLTSTPFRDETIITYDIEYLSLEIKLVLIYWMMKILQYLTSLILSLIRQLVINFHHRLSKMCGL